MRTMRRAAWMGLICLLGSTVQAQTQSWKTTSDVLAIGLPAAAAALTLQREDGAGTSQLAWTLGTTLLSTQVLKAQLPEERPDHSGNDSFPSGHTAVAFASARFIQKRYGALVHPALLYGAATLTAVARVKAEQHYAGDTVAGAVLGFAWAQYFTESRAGEQVALWPTPQGFALLWQRSW